MRVDSLSDLQLLTSEKCCIAYFMKMKWPNGFACPNCGNGSYYTVSTRRLPLFQCRSCRHQTSLTAGTVMEGTRLPLLKWAKALQFLSRRASINAVHLAEAIQVTYKTAWSILRKIRSAISQADAKKLLNGTVRAGLAFYGRDYLHQPFVKHHQEHPFIVGAAFDRFGGPEYVKIKLVAKQHMDGKTLYRSGEIEFHDKHVDFMTMDSVFLKRFRMHDVPLLPQLIHEARTWINRTFHGIGPKYLQSYMDEFCFRMNRLFRHESALDTLATVCLTHS